MPTTLRRLVDVTCVLGAIGMIAGVASYSSQQFREKQAAAQVAADLGRFREALALRAASEPSPLNTRGWPITIDPSWFGADPPRNVLVSPDRPWVEVATSQEASLRDPVVRITMDGSLASFWYNPYQGIIRARVPLQISDQKALELYNTINGTRIDSIFGAPVLAESGDGDELVGPPAPRDAVAGVPDGGDAGPEVIAAPSPHRP